MSLLVVGSVALDTVKTPAGTREDSLGGSAYYFSLVASFFTKVNIVGVVGEDFPKSHVEFLDSRGIDTRGLTMVPGSTFRWRGEYGRELNDAKTLGTELGVFADFHPDLPEDYRGIKNVFLGNIDPSLQSEVLDQITEPKLVVCDTMNYWIEGQPEALARTLKRVNILIINDLEAAMLSGEPNMVKAARAIRGMGPRILVVKRGEYGAMIFYDDQVFAIPAFPLEHVADPTGAGDSFAGGFVGHLIRTGNTDPDTLRTAMVYGSVMASYNVEDFSMDRLRDLTDKEIAQRAEAFRQLTSFEIDG